MTEISTRQARPHAGWHSGPLAYIVAATFFMEYLDTTIITTALPSMAHDFGVSPNALSLGLTAYMLTLAVFIPVSGWIADRFGSRTVFATAILVFTASSVACAAANGVAGFTAARVLQGLGGAMMVPVGRMIVVRNTEKSRLMQAISTITWPAIFAPVVGPSLGGFITTYASWHWIFLLNVPFGLCAIACVLALVPQQRADEPTRLDWTGFGLSAVSLSTLLYGTERASREDASVLPALVLIVVGIGFAAATVRHSRRHARPLLDFTPLRVATFAVTVLWGSATRIGVEAVPYLSPLLFQVGFGLSPFHSGLLLLATASGNLGMKAFTTPILKRFGFRRVALWNGIAASACIFALARLGQDTNLLVMLVLLLAYGLARSLQFTTLATVAYADISDAQKGPASTLWSANQQMTIGMGIAFGALCLRLSASLHASPKHAGTPAFPTFSIHDFQFAFCVAAALVLASVIGYARLPANAGDQIRAGDQTRAGDQIRG